MVSNFLKTIAAVVLITIISFLAFFETNHENSVENVEKTLVLNGGTYNTEIDVIITQDPDRAFEFVAEHIDSPITPRDFEASGVTFTDEEGRIVVWISDANDKGVVNHELLHATFSIMMWAGIPLNESTEESYAYQLQHLTNQFYNKIK